MARRRSAISLVLVLGLVLAFACSGPEKPAPTESARASASALSTGDVTIDLTFPAGFGVTNVAVGASHSLRLSDRAKIFAADGSPGAATNAGAGVLAVGNDVHAGVLTSAGNIQLGDRSTVTVLTSAGTVTVGNGDTVGTTNRHATVTPLVHRSLTVHPPPGPATSSTLATGKVGSLAPGRYASVTIQTGATAVLTAGTYVIDALDLEPQGVLQLDTSSGAIRVYVETSVIWRGTETGDGTRFILGYLGTGTLNLEAPFQGLGLAPFGTLQLASTSARYTGVFYGKDVVVMPGGILITEAATPLLLGALTVSPTTLCVGQETEVSVDASAAGPDATTWINGSTVGNHQFVQFSGMPGTRMVSASVYTGTGGADFESVPVTLQRCAPVAGQAPPVALRFGGALGKPNVVELMVHGYDAKGNEGPPPLPATFSWSFGDGQTSTTTTPLVAHDYTAAVNPMAPYSFFDVSVTVTSGAGTTSAKKVVSIFSLYALNRRKGIIQPPNTITVSPSSIAVTVTNHEPTPLSIGQANLELIPCDPALDGVLQPPQVLSVTVPASSTATVHVAPPGPFSPTICGYGVHLLGSSSAGKVFTDAYAALTENALLKQAVTDPRAIALLNQASGMTTSPNQFDEFELRQLLAQGRLPSLPPAIPPGTIYQSVGEECAPGDTPPNPLGLVCQPTADWVVNPAQYLNAFKGQFVLEHGCGSIAQLLASINQTFSHAGVMTKNRVEIRHSTASQDRVNGSIQFNNATPRLDPNIVKYAFPGTGSPVTVDQIVHSYCIPDPDGGGSGSSSCPNGWTLSDELNPDPARCATDGVAVPSIVVRSAPDAPAAIQQGVASVAAAALAVKSHYRFDDFSHADQALVGPTSPGIADWAIGTVGAVSSSFPRLSAVNALAGSKALLWPSVSPGEGVPDGMRRYTPEERSTAAHTLHNTVSNQVGGQCDPFLGFLFGSFIGLAECEFAISNISNQIVNCFANDTCDNTSSDWENPGPGVAVSEDDITHWDASATGGTYGYNEPLVYLPTSFRHKYAWVQAAGAGSMTVRVVNPDGSPIPSATVVLDGDIRATTTSTGTAQIASLPAGAYDVEAQLYTGPPLPPPQPPKLDDNGILGLPSCPATPGCKVGQGESCPDQWAQRNCAIQSCAATFENRCVTHVFCECYPPVVPAASCQFLHAGRSAVVSAGQTTNVTITLCTGACDPTTGLPAACPARCQSNDDCNNAGLVCDLTAGDASFQLCVPAPRLVHVATPPGSPALLFANGSGPAPSNEIFASLDLTCDPTLPSPNNTASTAVCVSSGPFDVFHTQLKVDVKCKPDLASPGGVIVIASAKVQSGCGSGASDQNDTATQQIELPPPSASNPTPSGSVGLSSCFTNFPSFLVGNPCDDNNATVGLTVTSNPHP